jgi:hypothetical protein
MVHMVVAGVLAEFLVLLLQGNQFLLVKAVLSLFSEKQAQNVSGRDTRRSCAHYEVI